MHWITLINIWVLTGWFCYGFWHLMKEIRSLRNDAYLSDQCLHISIKRLEKVEESIRRIEKGGL